MNIKLIRMPGGVTNITANPGDTVATVLSNNGISTSNGESVKVNGTDADLSTRLNDGDRITVSKGAKGN